jgi:hypothetical protein
MKAKNGEPMAYLLDHMHDGCCYPWPFAKQSAGYPHLYVSGKLTLASRFVCRVVNGDPDPARPLVRHRCGKGHLGCFNSACLEWGSAKENTADASRHGTLARGERVGTSKLRFDEVVEIRRLASSMSQNSIAIMFGVSQSQISLIHRGERW